MKTVTTTYQGDPTAGQTTTYEYDAQGRLYRETSAGLTTTYEYDDADQLIEETASNGTKTKLDYDALGNVTSRQLFENDGTTPVDGLQAAQTRYDLNGNVIHTVDQYGDETYTKYDLLGRIVEQYSPQKDYQGQLANQYSTIEHDAAGNVIKTIGFDGTVTEYDEFDQLGRARLKRVKTGTSTYDVTRYFFDDASKTMTVTDPSGTRTRFTYDGFKRVVGELTWHGTDQPFFETLTRSYDYDANGNLEVVTDRNGRTTVYGYDALNRRTDEYQYDENYDETDHIVYKFDDAGHLVEVSNSVATYAYSVFDAHGRARFVDQTVTIPGAAPLATRLEYEFYDSLIDELTHGAGRSGYSVTATQGTNVLYSTMHLFDAAGHEVTATQEVIGDLDKIATWAYQLSATGSQTGEFVDRRRTTVQSLFQTVDSLPQQVTTVTTQYDVEDSSQMKTVQYQACGNVLQSFTYEYTYQGLLRSYTTSSGTHTYEYDAAGQITQEDGVAIPYGGGGQRESLIYGPFSRVLNNNGDNTKGVGVNGRREYDYDDEGNRTVQRFTQSLGLQTTDYAYDNRNNLTQITHDYPGSPTLTTTYYYDALNRIVGKKTVEEGGATRYEYSLFENGSTRTARFSATADTGTPEAPTLQGRYFNDAQGKLIAVDDLSTNETQWAVADRQGTVFQYWTFNASGTPSLEKAYDYDVYGNPTGAIFDRTPEAIYRGQVYDPDAHLYRGAGGWYDPVIGEHLQLNTSTDAVGRLRQNRPTAKGTVAGPEMGWFDSFAYNVISGALGGEKYLASMSDGEVYGIAFAGPALLVGGGWAAGVVGGAAATVYGATAGFAAGVGTGAAFGAAEYATLRGIQHAGDAYYEKDTAPAFSFAEMGTSAAFGAMGEIGGRLAGKLFGRLLFGVGDDVAKIGGRADDLLPRATTPHKVVQLTPTEMLQNQVNLAVADLTLTPAIARTVLRPGEYAVGRTTEGFAFQFGNAVQRLVRDRIDASPQLRSMFLSRIGDRNSLGRFISVNDFMGSGQAQGLMFEVTTQQAVASHARRWYGDLVEYVTYNIPHGMRRF